MDRMLDPESSRERLEAWRGRIEQLAADTKTMSDQMEQLRVTVADPNRMVEVTVDSTGNLVDLSFSDRIKRVGTEVMSRTVMETIREAKRQVADRSTEIIETTIGSDSATAKAITSRIKQQIDSDEQAEGR